MSKRFTAREMRDILNQSYISRETVQNIISQAVDTEEELARTRRRWLCHDTACRVCPNRVTKQNDEGRTESICDCTMQEIVAERDKFKSAYFGIMTGGGRSYHELEAENKKLKAELDEKQFSLDECLRVLGETRDERDVLRKRVAAGLDACKEEIDNLNPNGNIDNRLTRLMEEERICRIRKAIKGEEVL